MSSGNLSLNWVARKPVGIATNTFAVMETQVLITFRSANDFPVPALPTEILRLTLI